jgi:hypothetical protein
LDKSFRDFRGLTSHTRHAHELNKEDIYNLFFMEEKDEKNGYWGILVSFGAVFLALIGFEDLNDRDSFFTSPFSQFNFLCL